MAQCGCIGRFGEELSQPLGLAVIVATTVRGYHEERGAPASILIKVLHRDFVHSS